MPDKAFIDTNVVIYALGPNSNKTRIAAALLAGAPTISTQVLSETANISMKKLSCDGNLQAACDARKHLPNRSHQYRHHSHCT